jgi:hypothetical protein
MAEPAEQSPPHAASSQAARVRAEYAEIETLLRGSGPGRRFLSEHARRSRAADSEGLLAALTRLEVVASPSARRQDRDLSTLVEMRQAIERMRSELAAIKPAPQPPAQQALGAIAETAERATSEILDAAEAISDAAWSLRETGASPALCDAIERRVTGIFRSCAVQAVSGRCAGTMAAVLTLIEQRLKALIEIGGGENLDVGSDGGLLNGQSRAEAPPLPVAAQAGLRAPSAAPATRPVAAETSRGEPSALATLGAVKRAALFG